MKTFFHAIAKMLAFLCAVLFVLTAALALVFFNMERRLFHAQLYLNALERQNFYERLPALAAETLIAAGGFNPCERNPVMCASEGRPPEVQVCLESALGAEVYQSLARNERTPTPEEMASIQPCLDQYPAQETSEEQGGPPDYLKALSQENWEMVLHVILPPEMLRSLTEQAFTAMFAYLNGQSDSATLSLVDFKAHISGPAGTQAVMEVLRAQPPCTLEQMAEMTASNLAGEPKLVFCNPSEEALNLIQPLIQSTLQTAAAGIPDTAMLIQPNLSNMQDMLNALRALRAILRFSPLLPMGFLLLLTLLTVRDRRDWLRWWGIPFLISGLLGLALALVAGPLANWAFVHYAAPRMPPALPESMRELARGLISSVLAGVSKPIAIQSAILGVIGLAMLVALRFKK